MVLYQVYVCVLMSGLLPGAFVGSSPLNGTSFLDDELSSSLHNNSSHAYRRHHELTIARRRHSHSYPQSTPFPRPSPPLPSEILRSPVPWLFKASSYGYIDSPLRLSHLRSVKTLYSAEVGSPSLAVAGVTHTHAVRSHQLLLQLHYGTVLDRFHLETQSQQVVSLGAPEYRFSDWALGPLALDVTAVHNLTLFRTEASVLSLMVPLGDDFTHITAALLPRLNFTCTSILGQGGPGNGRVLVLVPNDYAITAVKWVCPSAHSAQFVTADQFSSAAGGHRRWALTAKRLLFPTFYSSSSSSSAPSSPSHKGAVRRSDFSDLPHGSLLTVNNATFDANTTRSVVYIPRLRGRARSVGNEVEVVDALCKAVSRSALLSFEVFIPEGGKGTGKSGDPTAGRDSAALRVAAAVVSPHSSALSNLLFVPRDAAVVEITDLDKGNWMYAAFAAVLGLRYHFVRAHQFEYRRREIPLLVHPEAVVEGLEAALPQLRQVRPGPTTEVDEKMDEEYVNRLKSCRRAQAVLALFHESAQLQTLLRP